MTAPHAVAEVSLMCQAAADGGPWEHLHQECPGPATITVPDRGPVQIACDCECHEEEPHPVIRGTAGALALPAASLLLALLAAAR